MCLRPVKILNPAKRIERQGGAPFQLEVPCGHCMECKESKVSEYFLRSFYEAKKCFDNGGFVLFDTLTYRDDALPHISDRFSIFSNTQFDFPCFDSRHVRLFFVRLRTNLSRLGYDIKGKLTYFLASEYGADDRFTHRPHYHVLFFVNVPDLTPLILSKAISECWPFGRTDGIPFKAASYVSNKRVYDGSDPKASESACRYVTKYVVKSSEFSKVVNERIRCMYAFAVERLHAVFSSAPVHRSAILSHEDCVNTIDIDGELQPLLEFGSHEGLKYLRSKILYYCSEFHRQSNHFGEYALSQCDYNEVFESGCLTMPSSDKVTIHVPLSTYFKRKLFYELVDDFRGKKAWKLTDEGKRFVISRMDNSLQRLSARFSDFYQNLPLYRFDFQIVRSHIDKLLDGRSWKDFAKYLALFKGRVLSYDDLRKPFDFDNFVYREFFFDFGNSDCGSAFFNYCGRSDVHLFGPILTNRWLGDSQTGVKLPPQQLQAQWTYKHSYNHRYLNSPDKVHFRWLLYENIKIDGYDSMSLQDFVDKYVIKDTFQPCWRDFDRLYNYITSLWIPINTSRQDAYELKEQIRNRRKTQC